MASPFFSFLGSTCDLLNRVVMLLRYSGISNIIINAFAYLCGGLLEGFWSCILARFTGKRERCSRKRIAEHRCSIQAS